MAFFPHDLRMISFHWLLLVFCVSLLFVVLRTSGREDVFPRLVMESFIPIHRVVHQHDLLTPEDSFKQLPRLVGLALPLHFFFFSCSLLSLDAMSSVCMILWYVSPDSDDSSFSLVFLSRSSGDRTTETAMMATEDELQDETTKDYQQDLLRKTRGSYEWKEYCNRIFLFRFPDLFSFFSAFSDHEAIRLL